MTIKEIWKLINDLLPWIVAIGAVYKWFIEPKREQVKSLKDDLHYFLKIITEAFALSDQIGTNKSISANDLISLRAKSTEMRIEYLRLQKYLTASVKKSYKSVNEILTENLKGFEVKSTDSAVTPNFGPKPKSEDGILYGSVAIYFFRENPPELDVLKEDLAEMIENQQELRKAIKR